MENNKELINNIEKLHTTEMGIERIKKSLELDTKDVVKWCKSKIIKSDNIYKKRKKLVCNWQRLYYNHKLT